MNQKGTKSIKTSDNVDRIINKKSQITSISEPFADIKSYLRVK